MQSGSQPVSSICSILLNNSPFFKNFSLIPSHVRWGCRCIFFSKRTRSVSKSLFVFSWESDDVFICVKLLSKIYFTIFSSHKCYEFIIRCDNISIFFSTFLTLLYDAVSFLIFSKSDRWHNSLTRWCSISWELFIDMKRSETLWTMIACRTTGMFIDIFVTHNTGKCLISHYERHSESIRVKIVF